MIFRLSEMFEIESKKYFEDALDPCRIGTSSVLNKMYIVVLSDDIFMDSVNIFYLM